MTVNEVPPPPERPQLEQWEHFELYQNIRSAIATLPAYFRTETRISGINVTDLFSLNSVLGATIEEQAVTTLNAIRHVWDPDESYSLYSFVRQAQTFPDVLLKKVVNGDVLLGMELKGWYVLAKEGEPSFRYTVTPAACAECDLFVVVPWALAQVISGSPIVFEPYIESARWAAAYRNYHWQYIKRARGERGIQSPEDVRPYPAKADQISDFAVSDRGGNFGRLSRSGVMDEYLSQMKQRNLCGVRVEHWQYFMRAFQETRTDEEIRARLATLQERVAREPQRRDELDPILAILEQLERLARLGN